MTELDIDLRDGKCRIHVGTGLLARAGDIISDATGSKKFAIITNPTVRSLYAEALANSLESAGLECRVFEIPDSEESKSLEAAQGLYRMLAGAHFDRESCIIGLGGGAVGDLAGFVAATYHRGIGLVQVPTTLLAQVDSAIGGKTGVNIPEGKNLVGAFHQPLAVISDVSALRTLPEEHYLSGLAEVVKYGMVCDAGLFADLESNIGKILARDMGTLENVIARCSAMKAKIVQADERDRAGRVVLNFGHTLGHALESASGFGISHGSGVAVGMAFAARVAVKSRLLAKQDLDRLESLISGLGLPVRIPGGMDTSGLNEFMRRDKKSRAGSVRMVLPTGIGKAKVWDEAKPELVSETLGEMVG